MKNLNEVLNLMPENAKDIKINMQSLLGEQNQVLTRKQIFGSALASSYTAKESRLIEALENEASQFLDENEMKAAKTAAILMAMNNVYYRFAHIISDKEYAQMPAGLRMKGIVEHNIEKIDFEIFSLASSIINGCAMCIDAHAGQMIKNNMTKQQVQMVAKIAAVTNAAAQALLV